MRVGIFVERIWMTLPTLAIGGRVGVILWWWVVILERVNVFNVRGSIITLNEGMSLYITGLTVYIGPH